MKLSLEQLKLSEKWLNFTSSLITAKHVFAVEQGCSGFFLLPWFLSWCEVTVSPVIRGLEIH